MDLEGFTPYPFSFGKEAFMTLRVTHENENKLSATDHSIWFKWI